MNILTVEYQPGNFQVIEIPENAMTNMENFFTSMHNHRDSSELVELLEHTTEEIPQMIHDIKETMELTKHFKRIPPLQQHLENLVQNFLPVAITSEIEELIFYQKPHRSAIPQLYNKIRILSIRKHFLLWYQAKLRKLIWYRCGRKAA